MTNTIFGKAAVQIELKDFDEILKWFKEHSPRSAEFFYQVDDIKLSLPELGDAIFQLLIKNGLYSPKDD